MALLPSNSLVFTVRRHEPELVFPAKPTPRECKLLSDIDDQEGHRFQIRGMHFNRYNSSMQGKDPAKVIKEALAQTLVFYYPLAGRLREGPNRKLTVDCTGEGVLFTEADADVTLEEFGDVVYPPFPCSDELLYDVPGSNEILNCPLLLIQVTRLKCGSFIFAHRFNHTMSDGAGLSQFMSAMGEIARGALAPSTPPVWERHLLNARDSPLITCLHDEYDSVGTYGTIIPTDNLVRRSFFFGPTQISALRRFVPANLRCSTFDILSACVWRCRTQALGLDPDEHIRLICIGNARSKFNPPLPLGYYGNALGNPAASTTAGKLCQNPLEYALKLVKEAKTRVTEEYMKSTADLLVLRGRPNVNLVGSFLVSDLTRAKFLQVDFGWGEAAFFGPATSWELISFHMPSKNEKGEDGIVVPVSLPAPAMKSFVKELDGLLKDETATVGA
ncbi:benzyl alcohol O-benzoyltransferase-like [Durio zibethinus]|uniref:Benzyl alcohol O-benzoyltransferase-like n=1 Tax=Durio zibethinus TaxID=66656 RepID=A0A6P5YTI9_DURZI|nr:benzyl alcohol O-benzoyltransferase-like [Durio zibethinus]